MPCGSITLHVAMMINFAIIINIHRAKKVSYSPIFVVFLINQNIVATIDPEYVKVSDKSLFGM